MRIVMKSSIDEKQMEARQGIARTFNMPVLLELQLLDYKPINLADISEKIDGEFVSIHTPLDNITDFTTDSMINKSHYILQLASSIDIGRDINLIVHYSDLSDYEALKEIVEKVINLNKRINVCFENGTVDCVDGYINNCFYAKPVELVKRLRRDLKTDRVALVFDICHAISTINTFKRHFNYKIDLEDFFKLYAPYTNIIHFSNCIGEGKTKATHGVIFANESKFESVYRMCKEYMSNALLVLEFGEDDYYLCSNLYYTLNQIERFNSRKQ